MKEVMKMSKKLVTYFSATGVTKKVAEKISEITGGELLEIEPRVPYTRADLNWNDKKSRSTVEMEDKAFRPEIVRKLDSLDGYDTIFVGFPIWWYIAPTIVNTFLERYNLEGKKIIPYFTSGGSGAGKTNEFLEPSCKGATVTPAKRLNAFDEEGIRRWIEELGL